MLPSSPWAAEAFPRPAFNCSIAELIAAAVPSSSPSVPSAPCKVAIALLIELWVALIAPAAASVDTPADCAVTVVSILVAASRMLAAESFIVLEALSPI